MFECHFLKISQEPLNEVKVASQIMVSTIKTSSVFSLHTYISTVYAPMLFGDASEGAKANT